jgi:hypothetical protein
MKKVLVAVLALGGAVVCGHLSAITQGSSSQNRAPQDWTSQNGGAQATASQSPSSSQDDNADQDIAMLRMDIRIQKRHVIETNMPLTNAEAQKFWPVYDQYTAELVEINNDKYALIKNYTQSYDTMSDAQADDWAKRVLKLDADVATLRQKYWPDFRKVLPAKKTALFEQVERRTQMVIDVQLTSQFPLVQPK